MLNQSRSTRWRNRLTWLLILGILVNLSASVIFIRESDKSTLNTQAPISISSYFRDYALLSTPIRIDSKPYKVKSNGSYTTRVTLAENKKVACFLLPSQSPFDRSLCRISICFADIETTSQSWLGYACRLLDLPPPTPTARFIEPV